jgi:hypothetical protein
MMNNPKHQDKEQDSTNSRNGTAENGRFKGLCVNCKYRETCLYPKPEGGVWHCEEYEEDQ